MPLNEDLTKKIESVIADIKNYAGADCCSNAARHAECLHAPSCMTLMCVMALE